MNAVIREQTTPVRDEIGVGLLLAITIFGLGFYLDRQPDAFEMHQHLGGEYYNIGRALADGRGYSDPFGEPTGPTAWMPPLYPWLLATIIAVVKTRNLVGIVIAFLTKLSLVTIGITIHSVARRCCIIVSPKVSVGLYLGWLWVFRFWFLQLTHDIWLIALGVNCLVVLTYRQLQTENVNPYKWGALGGTAAILSPALLLAWASLVLLFLTRATRASRPRWLIALGLCVAIASPWTIRNAIVFHQFIPIKSNLVFDAYQANCVDSDGIMDTATMDAHPLASLTERFRYAKAGEAKYISDHRPILMDMLEREPVEVETKILHRLLAAAALYSPVDQEREGGRDLYFKRLVYVLPISVLILASFCSGGDISRVPGRMMLLLALIWVMYLVPYIFVSYYIRYALPLVTVTILMVYIGLDLICIRLSKVWSSGRDASA